jgi:uncharacterized protein with GYD domain
MFARSLLIVAVLVGSAGSGHHPHCEKSTGPTSAPPSSSSTASLASTRSPPASPTRSPPASPTRSPAASLTPTPSPAASFAPSNEVLTQESPRSWTTTILIAESPSCLKDLRYQLVTTSPDYLINGTPTGIAAVEPVGGAGAASLNPVSLSPLDLSHLGKGCGQAAGADSEVSLDFKLAAPFPTIPLGTTLVVDDPDGPVPAAAVQLMTVHRLVTGWQYLWTPLIYGGTMALLLIGAVGIWLPKARRNGEHKDSGRGFWRRPVYASAAWTFADSPATNIATVGTLLVAILAAVGTVSTLLPGVQLDRFAILMAVCAVIIAISPLAFGIFNTWSARSPRVVPQNGALALQSATIDAPGGASLTTSTDKRTMPEPPRMSVQLKAGVTVPVPPRSQMSIAFVKSRGLAVFPGDTSIELRSVSRITVTVEGNRAFTISSDALQPENGIPAVTVSRQRIRLDFDRVTGDDVTVKANGFVEFMVPSGTRLVEPTMIEGPGKSSSDVEPEDEEPDKSKPRSGGEPDESESRGAGMSTYVSLVNWTEQGIKDYKDTTSRAADFSKLVESLGGRVRKLLWTVGKYDIVVVTEFPDGETATAALLRVGSLGIIRTNTLRAFRAEEMDSIIRRSDGEPGTSVPTSDGEPGTSEPTSDGKPGTSEPTSDGKPGTSEPTSDGKPGTSEPTSDGEPDDDKGREFRHVTRVRVPLGDNTIVADMRSLIPAIMISVFGIGAEFGLLTVLGGQLSAEPRSVHITVILVVAVMAVFVLVYTATRTIALANSSPGSSLAPDSKTAAMP